MTTNTSLGTAGLIPGPLNQLPPTFAKVSPFFYYFLFFFRGFGWGFFGFVCLLAKLHITIRRLATKTTLQSSLLAKPFMYLTLEKRKRNSIYNAGVFFSHSISPPSIQLLPLLRQSKALPWSSLQQGNICRLLFTTRRNYVLSPI